MKDKVWLMNSHIMALFNEKKVNGYISWNEKEGELIFDEKGWDRWCWISSYNGMNATRILPSVPFDDVELKKVFSPFKFHNGKWDLKQFNIEYFKIIELMVQIANKYGLVFYFDLADECQQHVPTARKASAWRNNHQGIESFQESVPLWIEYVNKILTILRKYDVIISLGNEIVPRVKDTRNWVDATWREIRKKGIPAERCSYGAGGFNVDYSEKGEKNSNGYTLHFIPRHDDMLKFWEEALKVGFTAAWSGLSRDRLYASNLTADEKTKITHAKNLRHLVLRPMHKFIRKDFKDSPVGFTAEYALEHWGSNNLLQNSILFSDDGTYDGDTDCDIWKEWPKDKLRPNGLQWKKAIKHCRAIGAGGAFEHLPANRLNEKCIIATITDMSKAYKEVFGVYPMNWRKYEESKDHECDVDVTKKCDDGSIIITKECKKCSDGVRRYFDTDNTCPEPVDPDPVDPPEQKCTCRWHLNFSKIFSGGLDFRSWWKCLWGSGKKKCRDINK